MHATIRELVTAWAMCQPVDAMKEHQWFGVTNRTVIFRNGYGLRLSSWCSGQQIVGGGQWGNIHWQFRIW